MKKYLTREHLKTLAETGARARVRELYDELVALLREFPSLNQNGHSNDVITAAAAAAEQTRGLDGRTARANWSQTSAGRKRLSQAMKARWKRARATGINPITKMALTTDATRADAVHVRAKPDEPGIVKTPNGYRVTVGVRGHRRWKKFSLKTPITTIRAWRVKTLKALRALAKSGPGKYHKSATTHAPSASSSSSEATS